MGWIAKESCTDPPGIENEARYFGVIVYLQDNICLILPIYNDNLNKKRPVYLTLVSSQGL